MKVTMGQFLSWVKVKIDDDKRENSSCLER